MSYSWTEGLLNLLFPPACMLCKKRLDVDGKRYALCYSCGKSFHPAGWFCISCGLSLGDSGVCGCGSATKNLSAVFALSRFEERWRSVIHSFKYFGRKHLGESLGRLIGDGIIESGVAAEIDMVTAVPLHPEREKERGYNQSELMAYSVAGALGLPHARMLSRHRNTVSQISLSGRERRENMRGAFICKSDIDSLKKRRILLVDDVYTTGATMREAGRVLADAGAAKVTGAVAAFQQR